MSKREQTPIVQLCWDWVAWCVTRKYYFQQPGKCILTRLQQAKTSKERDAHNSTDLQFFNMAVHTLADMPQHHENFKVFYAHYMGEAEVIKRTAHRLGISCRTYYKRLGQFAKDAIAMSKSLQRTHLRQQALRNDVSGRTQKNTHGVSDVYNT